MSDALKNRLVGTIILVALAVIFLPQVLDGEKDVSRNTFIDVPEAPEKLETKPVEQVDIDAIKINTQYPQSTENLEPQDDLLNEINTDKTLPADSDSELENQDKQGVIAKEVIAPIEVAPSPEADIEVSRAGWVIQLGSFSNKANVKKLIKTVTTAGYRAYSEPVNTRVGELTKVFVGPELERNTLEKAIPHLKEITGLTGKITEYEVSAN